MVTIRNGYDESAFEYPAAIVDRGRGLAAASERRTLDLLFFGMFRPLAPARPVIRWLAGLVKKRLRRAAG